LFGHGFRIDEIIMAQKHIRSGKEVVDDFIASLDKKEGVNKRTLDAIRRLHAASKLTKTQLLRSLERERNPRSS
jgi:hypothetical protein